MATEQRRASKSAGTPPGLGRSPSLLLQVSSDSRRWSLLVNGQQRVLALAEDSGILWLFPATAAAAAAAESACGCVPLSPSAAVELCAVSTVTVRPVGAARATVLEAATRQEAIDISAALKRAAAAVELRQTLKRDTLLLATAQQQQQQQIRPRPHVVTLRGITLVWASAKDPLRTLGEIPLSASTVELKDTRTLAVAGENGLTVELTAESQAQAHEWLVFLLRAVALASEVRANFTPKAFAEASVKVTVDVVLKGQRSSMRFAASATPLEIIQAAAHYIQTRILPPTAPRIDCSLLLLKVAGSDVCFHSLNQPLSSDPNFRLLLRAFVLPRLCVAYTGALSNGASGVPRHMLVWRAVPGARDFARYESIARLLGTEYVRALLEGDLSRYDTELNTVRQAFAKIRVENPEHVQADRVPLYIGTVPLCDVAIPKTLEVNVDWRVCATKKFSVASDSNADDLAHLAISKFTSQGADIPRDVRHVLKIRGIRAFLLGTAKISSYDHIRKALIEKREIFLSLVPLPEFYAAEREKCLVVDKVLASNLPDLPPNPQEKPIGEFKQPFRIKAVGVCAIDASKAAFIFERAYRHSAVVQLSLTLFFGGTPLCSPCKTAFAPCAVQSTGGELRASAVWDEYISFPIPMFCLPPAVRICITLLAKRAREDRETIILGWVNCLPIGHDGMLCRNSLSLRLWSEVIANSEIGSVCDNSLDKRATVVDLQFEDFGFPVSCTLPASADAPKLRAKPTESFRATHFSSDSERHEFERLVTEMTEAPLLRPSFDQCVLIWKQRVNLLAYPSLLPKFLLSVDWADAAQAQEARRLLHKWRPLTPVQALRLLDYEFPDPTVRRFAVAALESLPDADLEWILQQLVWVLKFENFHDNPLSRFLLRRALASHTVGHKLFWLLRVEMQNDSTLVARYGLLLEAFLLGCGDLQVDLFSRQVDLVGQLSAMAAVVKTSPKEKRMDAFFAELHKIRLPDSFVLPLHPSLECSGIIVSECKIMKSFLSPLFLSFRNADPRGDPIQIIFKTGDDLRQDTLVLQMIRIMDKLWSEQGLDLRMTIYGVTATGMNEGMVEIVRDAETLGNIIRPGGSFSVFRPDILNSWLRSHNPPEAFEDVVETFCRSCAGSCVATWVLGIGDRHVDNILLCQSGKLCHIDFGHFLGHFLKFAGIEREKAPFVFTPQFAHILGGEDSPHFKFFESCSALAFNAVRDASDTFINLALLMLSIGLPELNNVSDVQFIVDRLLLGHTSTDAAVAFVSKARESLRTSRTQINDLFHLWWN